MPGGRIQRARGRGARGTLNLRRVFFDRMGYFPLTTGRRPGVARKQGVFPPMPGDFRARYPQATEPEWAIYWAHLQIGMQPGQDFVYQWSWSGGVTDQDKVDFFEADIRSALEIQGRFWHFQFQGGRQPKDLQRRQILESQNIRTVFIDEHNATDDPVYYLLAARRGLDFSTFSRGGTY